MNKLEQRIIEILEEECQKDNNGMYFEEIYTDRDDELSDEVLKRISSSEFPREKFEEEITEAFLGASFDIKDNVFNTIIQDELVQEIFEEEENDNPEEAIHDFLQDNFYVQYPYDHYLNQQICMDLIVDTGDGNYDFTLNQPFASWDGQDAEKIEDESALLWLAKQQGYTKVQLTAQLKGESNEDAPFLASVFQEVLNCTTSMNALTFFIKMSLAEWLDLHDAIQREKHLNDEYYPERSKGTGYLTLKANTPCGLYDPWNGAGSILELVTEKPVVIPFRFIDSVLPDGMRGYSVASIYGMCRSFWEEGCVSEICPMKNGETI